MNKPTRKELLICLKCRWDGRSPSSTDCPGDCHSKRDAIYYLLSRYGDGGPRVTRDALEIIINNFHIWDSAKDWGSRSCGEYIIDKLKEKGVTVEEEKSEKSNDEMLARIDRQIRDARMDETCPSKPEEEKHV